MLAASASVPFARAQAQGRGRRGGGRGTECCGGGRTGQWSAHGVCTLSWRGAAACWHAMLAQMHACVLHCLLPALQSAVCASLCQHTSLPAALDVGPKGCGGVARARGMDGGMGLGTNGSLG